MDYTTDTAPAVEDFLRRQRDDARTLQDDTTLEASAVTFCAVLRVIDGKEDDPTLTARTAALGEQFDAAAVRRDRFAGKIPAAKITAPGPDPYDVARRDALAARVGQVESEHAAHAALRDLNDEAGYEAEAEKHAAVMLELDGFHAAILTELAALSAKIPEEKPAEEVAATSRTGRRTTKKD